MYARPPTLAFALIAGATLAANALKILDDGVMLRSWANLVASMRADWGPTAGWRSSLYDWQKCWLSASWRCVERRCWPHWRPPAPPGVASVCC